MNLHPSCAFVMCFGTVVNRTAPPNFGVQRYSSLWQNHHGQWREVTLCSDQKKHGAAFFSTFAFFYPHACASLVSWNIWLHMGGGVTHFLPVVVELSMDSCWTVMRYSNAGGLFSKHHLSFFCFLSNCPMSWRPVEDEQSKEKGKQLYKQKSLNNTAQPCTLTNKG